MPRLEFPYRRVNLKRRLYVAPILFNPRKFQSLVDAREQGRTHLGSGVHFDAVVARVVRRVRS